MHGKHECQLWMQKQRDCHQIAGLQSEPCHFHSTKPFHQVLHAVSSNFHPGSSAWYQEALSQHKQLSDSAIPGHYSTTIAFWASIGRSSKAHARCFLCRPPRNMGKCTQFYNWNFPASKVLASHSKLGCHSRVDCAGCSIKTRRPKAMPRAASSMVLAANKLPQATDGYPAFPFGNKRLLWCVPWFLSNKFS